MVNNSADFPFKREKNALEPYEINTVKNEVPHLKCMQRVYMYCAKKNEDDERVRPTNYYLSTAMYN